MEKLDMNIYLRNTGIWKGFLQTYHYNQKL